jgi:hypothetical protein
MHHLLPFWLVEASLCVRTMRRENNGLYHDNLSSAHWLAEIMTICHLNSDRLWIDAIQPKNNTYRRKSRDRSHHVPSYKCLCFLFHCAFGIRARGISLVLVRGQRKNIRCAVAKGWTRTLRLSQWRTEFSCPSWQLCFLLGAAGELSDVLINKIGFTYMILSDVLSAKCFMSHDVK